jgi:hypothetical protein
MSHLGGKYRPLIQQVAHRAVEVLLRADVPLRRERTEHPILSPGFAFRLDIFILLLLRDDLPCLVLLPVFQICVAVFPARGFQGLVARLQIYSQDALHFGGGGVEVNSFWTGWTDSRGNLV